MDTETITIQADTESEAIAKCARVQGWTPDAIREVDSGWDGIRAWKCFANAQDAAVWDDQR